MVTLIETLKTVLLMDREVSIRRNTETRTLVVSVTGFNRPKNIKWCHSYMIEGGNIEEAELSHIIHLLNERITM